MWSKNRFLKRSGSGFCLYDYTLLYYKDQVVYAVQNVLL